MTEQTKAPKNIAHIGIAVRDVEASIPLYTNVLGMELEKIEEVDSEQVKVAFIKIGEARIELLEPLSEKSAIHNFLDKKGEGIHHIALEVEDINQRLKHLQEKGIRLINEQAKQGADNAQIAFLHPKSTNGVLFELCQHSNRRGI